MLSIWRTTVGKKVAMAITGLVLFGFVLLHMLGNLKIYLGPEKFNDYARFLREMGSPMVPHSGALWVSRAVLLTAAVIHVLAAVDLWLLGRTARPIPYRFKENLAAGYSTSTMRWGGIALLFFVIYHIFHLTVGLTGLGGQRYDPENVYANVVHGFSVWYISAFYVAAMAALGIHIFHGFWSLFQTLGLNSPRANGPLKAAAISAAVLIAAGNMSIPVAVLAGILR